MALAGSLDEFAIADVLALLAATSAQGILHLDAGGTTLALAVRGDNLIQGRSTSLVDALDAVMSSPGARFAWHAGTELPTGESVPSSAIVAQAAAQRAARSEMTSIVPSGDHHLELSEPVPGAEIILDPQEWSIVKAVGGGCDMDALVASQGTAPLATYRVVATMLRRQLLALRPPPGASAETEAPPSSTLAETRVSLDFLDSDWTAPHDHAPAVTPAPEMWFDERADEPADSPTAGTPLPATGDPALADRGPWPVDELAHLVAQAHDDRDGWAEDGRTAPVEAGAGQRSTIRSGRSERNTLLRFFSAAKV